MVDTVVTESQKIDILLHEYDALRDEIGGRTRDGFNLFAITVALAVGLTLLYSNAHAILVLCIGVLGGLVFAVAAKETFFRIGRAAERLRQIEASINERAGERILVWESDWGAAKRGWFREAWRSTTPPK